MRDLKKIFIRLKILFFIGTEETKKLKIFKRIKKKTKNSDLFKKGSESEKMGNKSNEENDVEEGTDDSSADIIPTRHEENPQKLAEIIQDYELWGPFLFTILFCSLVSLISSSSSQENSFIIFIGIIFSANMILYINSRLMLARVSFMQLMSVLGYGLFPFSIAALICLCLRHLIHFLLIWLMIILILIFSSIITKKLLTTVVQESKLSLLWYPILLYHSTLSFLIISTSHHLN
jgi:hypothetical protein